MVGSYGGGDWLIRWGEMIDAHVGGKLRRWICAWIGTRWCGGGGGGGDLKECWFGAK